MFGWRRAAKAPQRHRQHGGRDDDLLPLREQRLERAHQDRDSSDTPAILGATAKKAVTGVGAPS